MKNKTFNIFNRITVLVFTLISVLALLFIIVAFLSATHFYQASTELLNKDVAAHIAKFTSPFVKNGLDKKKADSVFYQAMVLSPSIEVYFLDTAGNVIDFHGADNEIKNWRVPLGRIKQYISAGGKEYIRGTDPRDPTNEKIFSAAEVKEHGKKLGYIYVILGSKEYRNVSQLLLSSHIGNLALKAILFIIVITFLISLYYVSRINRHFQTLLPVLQKFEQGDFDARFSVKGSGDLAPIPQAFNKMADLLTYNISRLKKSEEERKEFIANISHDLRTPLAIARGYAETMLIKEGAEAITQEDKEEYLKLVVNNISGVENMVQQLFEFSKIDSSRLSPQKQPFIFAEVALETINSFRLIVSEKNIKIDCTRCTNDAWINGDIHLLERVVQNLLGNAVKFTRENGTIKIEIESLGKELLFRIQNTGTLLNEEQLAWLNNNSPDNHYGLKYSNSGIGLALVKKILWLHQFPFVVCSDETGGNRFSFRMPIYTL